MPDLAHRSRTDVRKKPTSAPRFPHEPSTAQPSATRRTAPVPFAAARPRPPLRNQTAPFAFPLYPFGRRPAPSEDRTPERTATPSQQRGTQRRRSRRHRTRAGKRLFFGHETEFWHSTGETPFRMNPTTWGFPNCRIPIIPKTAGNRLRTCQNAVSWPKSNDLAARTAAFRGADGRARSSSIRRGPRPERWACIALSHKCPSSSTPWIRARRAFCTGEEVRQTKHRRSLPRTR